MSSPSSTQNPLLSVDADHPWLGLSSFTEETQRYFFGRDDEIAEIFVRVRDNTLTTLYGQSGLGKSSLLGAGLLPKLLVEGYKPVEIRLRYHEGAAPLLEQVFETIKNAGYPLEMDNLWEWLHHLEQRPADIAERPPVLVFDQFEELFTLGQRAERLEETSALFQQLAEVIENRRPAALSRRIQEDRRLGRAYDASPTPARIVITLREDFLSHLEQWKKLLPSLMKNRMALDLLDGPQALEAVTFPGRLEGRNLVSDEVGASIVRFVAKKKAHVPLEEIGAVPPLLSLVCDELNRLRLDRGLSEITADLVETQSADILSNFYHESFAGLPDAVRHFIEDRLITEGGHRNPVAREDALTSFRRAGVEEPEKALDQLVARRLISPEERAGLIWIEITHDVLAPLVVRSRDERLERERAAEAECKEREARKARNKLRVLLGLFSMLTLLAIGGAIYGFLSSAEAKKQRDDARYNEGLGFMLRAKVAEERKNKYPDTLLYAAQAIGYEGVGRPADAPDSLLRFIPKDRNPEAYQKARKWISTRPAYLPIWSSAAYPSAATELDVSADGRRLAMATADGAVRLWDLREQSISEIHKSDGQTASTTFDPFGERIAILDGKKLQVHNLTDEDVITMEDDGATMAYSPDGEVLATAQQDGKLKLWRDGKATLLKTGMKKAATEITFSADNSRAAAVFPSGVRVFFPYYGALAYAWETHQGKSSAASIRPDGERIAIGTPEGDILIHDSGSTAVLGRCSGEQKHEGVVTSLAYRPDGTQLASASSDGTVRLWDVNRDIPTVIATLRGHAGGVAAVRYFPGGKLLATAGANGSARIWNVSGGSMESPDLHHYLAAGWYHINPTSQEAQWVGGAGTANIPPDSLLGRQRAGAEVLQHLAAVGAWNGLAEGADVPPALLTAAEAAAKAGQWRTFDLHLAQMRRLKISLDTLQKFTRMQEPIANPEKPYRNPEGIDLIWCKPGTFQMGSPENEPGRKSYETQHEVTLTQGFWLAKTELTQEQWIAVMGTNPRTYASSDLKAPVENISWNEAMEYCRHLTDRARARGSLPPGWRYTLPTEAQWEYASRADGKTAYSFGDNPAELHKHGNYNDISGGFTNADVAHDDGHKYTAPVASYPANDWGFHDMHGNVWEWCRDSFDPQDADYDAGAVRDPLGSDGTQRVNRGGGFYSTTVYCLTAHRGADQPSTRSSDLGFRLALVTHPVSQNRADEAGVIGNERSGAGGDIE